MSTYQLFPCFYRQFILECFFLKSFIQYKNFSSFCYCKTVMISFLKKKKKVKSVKFVLLLATLRFKFTDFSCVFAMVLNISPTI